LSQGLSFSQILRKFIPVVFDQSWWQTNRGN